MNNILETYLEMPPVTRAYTTACVLTTLAVVCFSIVQVALMQNICLFS